MKDTTIGFRPAVLVLLLLVVAAPVWSQSEEDAAPEDEGDGTVTISWGSDEEEDRQGILGAIEGGGGNAAAEDAPSIDALELPTLQYSAGVAGGVGLLTDPETGEPETSTPLLATGTIRYALGSPLLGDSFRAGTGRQVGLMVSLGTDSLMNAITGIIDFRSSSGQLSGFFVGIGGTVDGVSIAYGAHVTDQLVVTALNTFRSTFSDGTEIIDIGAVVGIEYLF